MQVKLIFGFLLTLSFAHPGACQQQPEHGELREEGPMLLVWHRQSRWISPDRFFELELERLDGPTYGTVRTYPPYANVSEWETLIDQLPDGRTCPMVFFHQRWRRLPDVLGLHPKLRNFGGCADVFDH